MYKQEILQHAKFDITKKKRKKYKKRKIAEIATKKKGVIPLLKILKINFFIQLYQYKV